MKRDKKCLSRKKRSFSLIEFLMVMLIISLIFGSVKFAFPRIMKEEAFAQGIEQVLSKIVLGEEIMLNYRCDGTLILRCQDGYVSYEFEKCAPLSPQLYASLNDGKKILQIDQLAFNDHKVTELIIHFDGSLGRVSEGKLSFFSKDQRVDVILPGFPTRLSKGNQEYGKWNVIYPEEIASL